MGVPGHYSGKHLAQIVDKWYGWLHLYTQCGWESKRHYCQGNERIESTTKDMHYYRGLAEAALVFVVVT
jgi:hypothetical protein